jgi:hypothetical protein
MRVAVAAQLVASRGDLADEVGIAFGCDPEHEKGCPSAELVEEREDRLGLALEGGPRRIPVGSTETTVDELMPVLEVEAEQELRHSRNSKATARGADPL